MERRKFLSMALGAVALAAVPASVRAEDFRKLKPTVWTTKNVMDGKKVTDKGVMSAIKALYGSNSLTMEGVKLKAPDVASNGGAIPVSFSTNKDVKSIAVFQNANPEAAVMVVDVNKYSVNKYSIKIKMASSGTITIVAQGNDGKLYAAQKTLDVALGGCEG
ncbi:Sulfur oxidation protein SoxY [hydrothermal vent metagenome]|uniref:Sulfur oxidation protein SoxY n=1 Tax=hydrothermal vent metagenome TaxID=652676 RepID=A0A1W1BNT4_9ZZZZ